MVGFENTIRTVTGETDESLIQQIGERAIYLYNDRSQGYQRAMWLYKPLIVPMPLGAAALANKVGESWLVGFFNRILPRLTKLKRLI